MECLSNACRAWASPKNVQSLTHEWIYIYVILSHLVGILSRKDKYECWEVLSPPSEPCNREFPYIWGPTPSLSALVSRRNLRP